MNTKAIQFNLSTAHREVVHEWEGDNLFEAAQWLEDIARQDLNTDHTYFITIERE